MTDAVALTQKGMLRKMWCPDRSIYLLFLHVSCCYVVVHCLAPAAASITSLSHCISPSPLLPPIQMRPPAVSHPDTPHTASSTKQKLRNPGNSNESDSDASIQALEHPPNLVRGRKNAPIIIDDSDSEQDAARPAKRLRIENAHSPIPESIAQPPSARQEPPSHRNASSHVQAHRLPGSPSAAGPSKLPPVERNAQPVTSPSKRRLAHQSEQPFAGSSRSYASTTVLSPTSIRRTKSNGKVHDSHVKTPHDKRAKRAGSRAPVLSEIVPSAPAPWFSSGPSQYGAPASSPPPLGLPPVEYLDDEEEFLAPPNQIPAPTSSPAAPVVLPPSDPAHPDVILQKVLEILPDLEPEWASVEIAKYLASGHTDRLAEVIVDRALELEGGYPKVIEKAKEKNKEEEPEDGYKLNTYRYAQRSGPQYYALATQYPEAEFPLIPTT